jgi:hypothetical protein
VVEAYRHLVDDELDDASALAAAVLERRVVTCDVAVANILELRPPSAQSALHLADAQLYSEVGDYAPCQAIGAAAHQLGLAGIIAPAATAWTKRWPSFRPTSQSSSGPRWSPATSGTAFRPIPAGSAPSMTPASLDG